MSQEKLLKNAKDWIIYNQKDDGRITWDEKGKCDPWDHCECLIALALFEEWDPFIKGVDWFFNTLSQDGLIYPEFQNNKHYSQSFRKSSCSIYHSSLDASCINGER